jgi:DNA-binding XRE family transcriptional regulator
MTTAGSKRGQPRPLSAAVAADAETEAVPPRTEWDYRRQVGRRLALQRIWHNVSQAELAARAGVGRGFVSGVERGTVGLDAWRLRLLADALGKRVGWLLDDPYPPPPSLDSQPPAAALGPGP